MDEEIWTIREVALFLKVKPVTIYKLANNGRIPGVKIAGSWRFKRNLIQEWIETDCKRMAKLRKQNMLNAPVIITVMKEVGEKVDETEKEPVKL